MKEQFKDVFDKFAYTLKNDNYIYSVYKECIASEFVCELHRQNYKLPNETEIALNSAENFLQLLISIGEKK